MGIKMRIHNIKSISDFEFDIPTERGLYALTGENASGKSTVLACAATAFYNPNLYSYFGKPYEGAVIEFEHNGRIRAVTSSNGKWKGANKSLYVSGFFEGSLVFGNRFKDVDFALVQKLAEVSESQLESASTFVKENLGDILHDNKAFYDELYYLKKEERTLLDRDIEDEVPKFMKKERIGFAVKPHFLPVQSLEKFLLEKLTQKVDHSLFRELNDYVFQGKSLDEIIHDYLGKVRSGEYSNEEEIKNGKTLYKHLKHELSQIRKVENELIQIIVDYLFRNCQTEVEELATFLEQELSSVR